MNRLLSVVTVFSFLIAVSIPVAAQQATRGGFQRGEMPSAEEMMERMKERMEEAFDAADEDEDGSLTKEEFKEMNSGGMSAQSSRQGQQGSASTGTATAARATRTLPSSGAASGRQMSDEERKKLEEARDKRLEEQFTAWDEDENKKLSKKEYLDGYQKDMEERMKQRQQQRGEGQGNWQRR